MKLIHRRVPGFVSVVPVVNIPVGIYFSGFLLGVNFINIDVRQVGVLARWLNLKVLARLNNLSIHFLTCSDYWRYGP